MSGGITPRGHGVEYAMLLQLCQYHAIAVFSLNVTAIIYTVRVVCGYRIVQNYYHTTKCCWTNAWLAQVPQNPS